VATDSGQFNYGGSGEVYLAPVGTAMPAAETEALNALFLGLGYTTEDGVTIQPSVEMNEVRSWQSGYPTDRRVNTRDLTIQATLQQLNKDTFKANFGGGTWATATGTHTYTPPAEADIDYKALIVHWADGVDITRLLVPKVLVSEQGSLQIQRATPSEMGITWGLITTGVGNPYTVISNRPEWATP
jgi:hypothetical protein